MSNARFWFVPLKDIAPAEQQAQLAAKEDVRASDLPASFNVPSKLYGEGIRAGHVLALHDGDTIAALARVLALDSAGSPVTMKTYTIGTNPSNGRTTLTLNVDVGSFSVWRDLGRLAGVSYNNPSTGQEVFEFVNPTNVTEAEALLAGALWERA